MTYRVHLLPSAEADLDRLVDFLLERDINAALRASTLIREAIATLDESPGRGRPTANPAIRELVIWFGRGAYVVQYRIQGADVAVAQIWHSNEDRRL
ncbi:type II toxin-antitoxin system RelE/ParE family toxin [Caulobacter sp. NIBR1757]|uniref:type II toxin-antitoxin system RelE/ParE family toxin n=1 Tax=Caulobacter sp. NIBR1757 TaxID=3016000 RepID=UPI0022F02BA7|nr:type II toxin-antitoxin system RelE/ParE family toxin [Caulobacter sp. NIBR1757]WGM38245.1 Toxin RelE1 [Caulobacter sp. NIBR1757]